MSYPPGWGDPVVVPKLIANHMLTTANAYAKAQALPDIDIDYQYLTDAISEITPETQLIGAALLQVSLADPAWKITRSGMCDKTSEGMLYQVDVNFPEGTPVWWRLVDVTFASVDGTQGMANLTMTFQHRIVSYLSDCWGPLGWPAGKAGDTRAQFIKMLVGKMPKELPKQSIGPGPAPDDFSFVCPNINQVQPIAGSSSAGNVILTQNSNAKSQRHAKVNKQPALTVGTKLTIRGSRMSDAQVATANAVLAGCVEANASPFVTTAAILVGMNERTFNGLDFSGGHPHGPFWDPMGTMSDSGVGYPASPYNNSGTWSAADATKEAKDWCTGGGPWSGGWGGKPSAEALAHTSVTRNGHNCQTAIGLAQVVQGNGGPYEDHYPAAEQTAEAEAIVNAYSGGSAGGAGGGSTPTSDVAQLARGSTDDPDEDSWACMQRLASEVNWSLFTSPSPAPGVFGNYIYYIDGPSLVAQKPALYLELSEDGTVWSATDPDTGKTVAHDGVVNTLSGEFDNTALQRYVTTTVKGKRRRKRTELLNMPQTPAQITFNMICGGLEFNAGDVFVFHEAGPANGRWIVEDVTQNMLGDLYAQFTLGPPAYPYPEPQAQTSSKSKSGADPGTVAKGTAQGAADIALQALAREQKSHCFIYQQRRPIDFPILTANPVYIDCSGFVIACYKLAGLPDPSNNNYDGDGYTGDMITHCTAVGIGSAQPGDMVFYGPYSATEHVTIYVGNGQVVSMGQTGDPDKGPWQQMGPAAPTNGTLWRSNYLTGKEVAKGNNQTPKDKTNVDSLPLVAGPAAGINGGSGGMIVDATGVFSSVFNRD